MCNFVDLNVPNSRSALARKPLLLILLLLFIYYYFYYYCYLFTIIFSIIAYSCLSLQRVGGEEVKQGVVWCTLAKWLEKTGVRRKRYVVGHRRERMHGGRWGGDRDGQKCIKKVERERLFRPQNQQKLNVCENNWVRIITQAKRVDGRRRMI